MSRSQVRPSALAREWGVVASLWRRDMIHLFRERSRWLGVVLQPLLLWLLLGVGFRDVFTVEGLEELSYLTFLFPGIVLMVILFTTVFATMAVIEDRQTGFLQQLAVAPTSRASMVFGKTAGVTTVALAQLALCLLAAPSADLALGGIQYGALLGAACLSAVTLTGLSFALAWMVSSTHAYHALMGVVLIPLWAISGAMFPVTGGWMGFAMMANPMTYMVDGLRHAFHGGAAPLAQDDLQTTLLGLVVMAVAAQAAAVFTASRSGRWRP